MPDKHEVHTFESTKEAYDASQAGYTIWETMEEKIVANGDIMVVPSEGVVGFLCDAWPVAVVYPGWKGEVPEDRKDPGSFHTMSVTDGSDPEHPAVKFATSIQQCIGLAATDADITGNDHWRE